MSWRSRPARGAVLRGSKQSGKHHRSSDSLSPPALPCQSLSFPVRCLGRQRIVACTMRQRILVHVFQQRVALRPDRGGGSRRSAVTKSSQNRVLAFRQASGARAAQMGRRDRGWLAVSRLGLARSRLCYSMSKPAERERLCKKSILQKLLVEFQVRLIQGQV
jgi:hypothetical protein